MITATVSQHTEEDRPMFNEPWPPRNTVLTDILVACLMATTLAPLAAANEVLKWNETALKAVTAGGQNPVQVTRTIAMVQGAVHDALNAINRRYAAYYFEEPGTPGTSPDAAVATAAHTVLVGVLPSFGTPAQKVAALAIVEDAYLAALSSDADAPAKTSGVAVGRAAGAAMLALRKDDGALRDAPHTPGTGPGKWRPHPNPDPPNPPIANPDPARGYASSALPGWANVTPFTLLSAAQFWLPDPPALTSESYASPPSARATPTAILPLPGTQAGIVTRTPLMSQTTPRPRASSAGLRQQCWQVSSVQIRSPSRP